MVSAFFIMLPAVSLLGENDRATTVVQGYFDDIALKDFYKTTELCTEEFLQQFSDLSDMINQQFSLETAMLEFFGISPQKKYTIEARRSSFWVPYFGNDLLTLSIAMTARDESDSIVKNYFHFGAEKYLENFITLIRDGGRWKIHRVNIKGSDIEKLYQKASTVMTSSSVIVQDGNRVKIEPQDINLAEMDSVEKRILSFQLNKLLSLLNQDAESGK